MRIRTVLITAIMAILPISAGAAPIVLYDSCAGNEGDTCAIGIDNLDVNGQLFNVDFVDASYDTVYASLVPYFFGDAAGADDAANAIMDTLNAEAIVPEINEFPNEVLWVAYDVAGTDFLAAQVGHDTSAAPWQRFGNFMGDRGTDWDPWYFATFTEVPEPGTILLLGTGLALIGWRRRRALA